MYYEWEWLSDLAIIPAWELFPIRDSLRHGRDTDNHLHRQTQNRRIPYHERD
jgi:hypothetical protein